MSAQPYCGLSQKEAEIFLAEFVSSRQNFSLEPVINSLDEVQCFEIDGDCDREFAPFTESLDSMREVRAAMNREEKLHYMDVLLRIVAEDVRGGAIYEAIAAEPKQHVRAALEALGKKKESR